MWRPHSSAFLGTKMIGRHQSLVRRALLRSATAALPAESATFAQRTFSSSTAPPAGGDGTTHFGFQQVREEEKKPMVASVFHKVAERYVLQCNSSCSGWCTVWYMTAHY